MTNLKSLNSEGGVPSRGGAGRVRLLAKGISPPCLWCDDVGLSGARVAVVGVCNARKASALPAQFRT